MFIIVTIGCVIVIFNSYKPTGGNKIRFIELVASGQGWQKRNELIKKILNKLVIIQH